MFWVIEPGIVILKAVFLHKTYKRLQSTTTERLKCKKLVDSIII
jgi:hypothetical protein